MPKLNVSTYFPKKREDIFETNHDFIFFTKRIFITFFGRPIFFTNFLKITGLTHREVRKPCTAMSPSRGNSHELEFLKSGSWKVWPELMTT